MTAFTTIDDPSAYFKVQLYTGTGSSHAVTFNDTDTDMQPDMVWLRYRNAVKNHYLFDSIRGATKNLAPNDTDAEGTDANTLTAFGSDGFTVGTSGAINTSSGLNVAWCWKAGTTSGITTTGANITPSAYSFNATSGFSIIKYEGNGTNGTNTAHALGAVPHMMIIKRLENANYWAVYHHKSHADPEDYYLVLNENYARGDAGIWKDTPPTSVYFRHDNSTSVNANGEDMIAYLFTSIQGYSKFGGYTGNGNADGTFVYTGFRPAFVMIKNAESTQNWTMNDNKRLGYNVDNNILFPNHTGAENTGDNIDLLSNGFKIRWTDSVNNTSGETYVYAAFAEAPFVNSNGVPCNAR
uniref:DUF7483 domain-containing protein n=1 Tax=uncultured Alphaproteobacteria bacterium TaxID=91750 RepID=A0A1B0Z2I5_9PROT|nr:hypothetical protein [uncultured Alphaproteobacteria bacterium]ANO58412.1 hypothetical protein [uncultured Alphaproteobacteria bacterium]